jgi:hypothetical protein
MRVLVGCETSGRVREAFRARGHDAWSCDLLPADDGSAWHMQCDVRVPLRLMSWDLFVVHPTCTYVCSSGLHWNLRRPERAAKTEEALSFIQEMLDAPVDKIVLENPIGCISTRIRPYDQLIQPWQFGDNASKATCLWLKGVGPLRLRPELFVPPRIVNGKKRWANQTDNGQNKLTPGDDRWKLRSETYVGIANAFAENWG